MPLGNGHMGAMVYGGAENELIRLNHDTLWSGVPGSEKLSDKTDLIKRIRECVKQKKYKEADTLSERELSSHSSGEYLPMGDICIKRLDGDEVFDYRRELSLDTAAASVKYTTPGDRKYSSRMFISYPHDVMIAEIKSEKPLSVAISADSYLDSTEVCEGNIICVTGKTDKTKENTISYAYCIQTETDGEVRAQNTKLYISNAAHIVLYIACDTNFVSYDKNPDSSMDITAKCIEKIERAARDGVEEVYRCHLEDYQELYHRVSLELNGENENIPTDERMRRVKSGEEDSGLTALEFQYGRYLMIAGSRSGSQPLNLQGIWNYRVNPPWRSNYTLNINTEMNYWPAENCNLPECHEPLFKLIEELSEAGRETAKQLYGCEGFAVHHNSDVWRKTGPATGKSSWAVWPMAGGWLCRHLWEHYRYSGDREFLEKTAYPITAECAKFFLDYLTEDESGYLGTCPSTSPENRFIYDGEICAISKMSTMDMSIIKEVFGNVLKMAELLGTENEVTIRIREAMPRLFPFQIGSDGRLQEWFTEFEELEKGHRHMSHLYGLYPSDLITSDKEDLWGAARKSLEYRLENGGGHTGWSCGWIINLFARLGNGEKANQYVNMFLEKSACRNLFCLHPPFQIDGNFAFTAGIAEMLLQCEEKDGKYMLHILPAIPEKWKSGSVKGLCTPGGFVVDIEWKENGEVNADVVSKNGNTYVIASIRGVNAPVNA